MCPSTITDLPTEAQRGHPESTTAAPTVALTGVPTAVRTGPRTAAQKGHPESTTVAPTEAQMAVLTVAQMAAQTEVPTSTDR